MFDETEIITVQEPDLTAAAARRGIRRLSALTSDERGTLITVRFAVIVFENTICP